MNSSAEAKEVSELPKQNQIEKEEIKEPTQQIKKSDMPCEEDDIKTKTQTQEINKKAMEEEIKIEPQPIPQTSTNSNAAADDEFGDFGDFDKAAPKKEEAPISSNEYIEVVH
jgi:hypothetical protein